MKNQSAAKAKASMTKRTKKVSAPSAADTFRAPADEAGAKKVAPVMVYLSEDERKAFKRMAFESVDPGTSELVHLHTSPLAAKVARGLVF